MSIATAEIAAPPLLNKRQLAAVVAGNGLEFYDFLTFVFFAVQIGRTFFPLHDATNGLLLTLGTFGAGFLTRPVGAIVLGRFADRVGRRPAMMLSFTLMGVAIFGLALTPSYASIGMAAPIAVLFFRLVQGFALGGEVGPTTAYLIEAAPPLRRGLYVSLQYATQNAAVLAGGLVGYVLANLMSQQALDAYGWRIAFLIGGAIVPFGLYMRSGLSETLFAGPDEAEAGAGFRPYARVALLGIVMLAGATIGTYGLDYLTTYATVTLGMPSREAFGATVAIGAFGMLTDPLAGLLSDRFGRKRVMIPACALFLLVLFPAFLLIGHYRTGGVLFSVSAVLTIIFELASGPVLIAITESMPRRIRAGSVSIIYALSISAFGGSAQFIMTGLLKLTGNPLSPAFYIAVALVLGLGAMLMMRETAPIARQASR